MINLQEYVEDVAIKLQLHSAEITKRRQIRRGRGRAEDPGSRRTPSSILQKENDTVSLHVLWGLYPSPHPRHIRAQ